MKKVVFLPYDMDTILGINNEGALTFGYELEDIDKTDTGADVYNGQQSVLWMNMRQAFGEQIKKMYQELRSEGKLDYEDVESRFEEHQSKWPEAIFNEDAQFKYIDPLLEDNNASYLSMLQGSKKEQRKWWLYNRFRYMDSKYNAGDALKSFITLRGYAKSNISITPYANIYAAVKYGSYLIQTRAHRNNAYELECPLDNVNDTEIYIYSADQLKDVGDLSGFMVGYADFSSAVKIQALKLGDESLGYSNSNLKELYLGNNTLLKTIDIRNCPGLGTGEQKSVDLSGCSNIEHVYFDGTSVAGITLPNGGILKTLHLPGTVSNLTICNQPALADFAMPTFANITTLRLENVSNAIPVTDILESIQPNSRVRLIGFDWKFDNTAEIFDFYNYLDTMRGLDEAGNNMDVAQVSGTIHVADITGTELAEMLSRYPYINITYDLITSKLYYYNYDGTELLHTEEILDGGNGTYSGKPSRPSTPQYTFAFAGWSKTPNGSANTDALIGITANRKVYAAYTSTIRKYTVRFYNGNKLLLTVTDVPYGGSAKYAGADPVHEGENPDAWLWIGWDPSPNNITGDTSCYAQFTFIALEETITDSWEEIIASTKDGTYKDRYSIGDTKTIDLGTEGKVNMQIVAFDADDLADGTGKAPITWISEQLLATNRRMNQQLVTNYGYREGNGWGDYHYATSPNQDFIISSGGYIKANEVATLIIEFTAAIDFTVQEPRGYMGENYVGLAKDWEYEVTVNGTTIYQRIGPNVIVEKGTEARIGSNDRTTIVARFKQDSKATPTASGHTSIALKFLDEEGNNITLATAVCGTNDLDWENKVTITKSTNQIRYIISYVEGTGTVGGWEKSELRTYLNDSIKPQIPALVRTAIKPVTKKHQAYNTSGSLVMQTTEDEVWIPEVAEMYGTNSLYYPFFLDTNKNRVKKKAGATNASRWWLRTHSGMNSCFDVELGGNRQGAEVTNTYTCVAIGFCL